MKATTLRLLADIEEKKASQCRTLANWYALLHWRQTESNAYAALEKKCLEAALIYRIEASENHKENEGMMKSLVMAVFLTLFTVALLVGMPVIAQDEPLATNTPDGIQVTATINGVPVDATLEPTSELPVVVVNQPAAPNDNAIYAVGFIVLMGFAALFTYVQNRQLSTLMGTVSKVLDNKQVIDEGHRLYMESSLSVQNVVTLIQGVASYLGTVIPGEDLAEIIARGITNVKNPPASVPFEAGPNGTVYKVVPQVEFQGGRGAEPILGNNLPPTPDQNDPVG